MRLSISIGISVFIPEKGYMQNSNKIALRLIHCADTALYKAKASGRNKISVVVKSLIA